jgi:hypothetical protein
MFSVRYELKVNKELDTEKIIQYKRSRWQHYF